MINKIPEVIIGVLGHIDHGKTTLLSKLTGKFTDTHSEELKRGITIKLGYADMIIYTDGKKYSTKQEKSLEPARYVSFIDAPGHEMLMATMLSGASIIDAAILVIAANEGIKPQTKEHFTALQAKKIKNIIIVQNKIDLVSKENAVKNYGEIKEFVKGTFAENCPVIPISAQQEINIGLLLKEITNIKIPERDLKSSPVFLVARSFDINRPGTEINQIKGGVLGGVLKKGKLKIGDEIEIKPGIITKKGNQTEYNTITTKIINLFKGKDSVKEVTPGASISIETELDPFLAKTDSLTGCVVSLKGILPEITNKLKLKINLLNDVLGTDEKIKVTELKTKEMLMINANTSTTVGIIESIKQDEATLDLTIPIIAIKGDYVGMARNFSNHWRLIGWGEIV